MHLQEALVEQPIRYYVSGMQLERVDAYSARQQQLVLNPMFDLDKDIQRYIRDKEVRVGSPSDIGRLFNHFAESNVVVVLGAALGDEGKGSVVDRAMSYFVNRGLKKVYVTRFNGGSNAGHTVTNGEQSVKLHQIASAVFQPENVEVKAIMDAGMTFNPVEFQLEYNYVENTIGKNALKGRMNISDYAILNTDLDRAEEVLLDIIAGRKSGSTGRGIRTSTGHFYERTGLFMRDLIDEDWEKKLGSKYDQLAIDFSARGESLEDTQVPDYEKILAMNQLWDELNQRKDMLAEEELVSQEAKLKSMSTSHTIGTKDQFLKRLGDVRRWLIEEDMVHNMVEIHMDSLREVLEGKAGHMFETAQALGLHPTLGTIGANDTTSTITDPEGVLYSTKVWRINDKNIKLGVFKATYTSSVGRRRMPTLVDLNEKKFGIEIRRERQLPVIATPVERWAAWVRETANEFGTTTGRARDICHLDLPMLTYNCFAGKINMLAATHLDVARRGEKIKVCTHYLKNGTPVAYYPGIDSNTSIVPQYVELDGWNKEEVRNARSFNDLPVEAKTFLSFIQSRTGVPIVMSTTGPSREHLVKIPPYEVPKRGFNGWIETVYDRMKPPLPFFPN